VPGAALVADPVRSARAPEAIDCAEVCVGVGPRPKRPVFLWVRGGADALMAPFERGQLDRDVQVLRGLWEIAERGGDQVLEQATIDVLRERLARLRALDAANDVFHAR
jgi:hypothetical protein